MDALKHFTGPTNELAKERNRAAAERTLAAWINTSTILIGFGLALDPLYQRLQILLPSETPINTSILAYKIGLLFIGLGVLLLLIAMVQHYLAVQSLEREDYVFVPSRLLNGTATAAVVMFGVLSIMILVLGLS